MIKHMCPVQSSFYRHTEIMQLKDQQETFWEKGEKVLLGFKVIARQDPKRKKYLFSSLVCGWIVYFGIM